MSKLLDWLRPKVEARDVDDPRYWTVGGAGVSEAGVRVTADTALTLSTFWACVRFLSETIGSLPLMIYQRRDDGGRERARQHPLYSVLHERPNQWQSPAEFKSMMQGHVLLRGNAYAQIVAGSRGPVDQLIPLHPDRVTVETLANGRLRYRVTGLERPLVQDEVFHLRGMSSDGVRGLSVIEYAANSVGLTMAAERYGARFFKNDSRPGGVLSSDRKLSSGVPERMKERWRSTQAGEHRGEIAILEEGLTFQAIGVPPEEAQFLGTREHQALDVCRWFGVAPHMVGVPGGVTEWGSGLEQLGQGVVTYTLMPWLVRWQEAITRDLLIAPRRYYAEFLTEGLLRGDITARYAAYSTGRQWGWLNVNEIRLRENMNPIGAAGNVYLQPLNMVDADGEHRATPDMAMGSFTVKNDDGAVAHHRALAMAAAGRLVRKEYLAMGKLRERAGNDEAAWETAVRDFFTRHAGLVSDTMQMGDVAARDYCEQRAAIWLAGDGGSEQIAMVTLVGLALGGVEQLHEAESIIQ